MTSHPRLPGLFLSGLLAVLLAAPLPATAAVTRAELEPGAAGAGDRYFLLDGNGGIDVQRYRIRTRYQFGKRRLSGRTVLTIRATQDLSAFNLDFLLPVRSVTVDGKRASFRRPNRHELTITPRRPVVSGDRFKVRVEYAGRPGRVWWRGESNWLANDHEVVVMNQPHMAAWWFPANDHPSDKARMDISVTVPRRKQVFANGERVSRKVHGRLATTRWVAREPMATYLATFAAGDFLVERGVRGDLRWRVAVSRSLPGWAQRENLRLMRRTPRIVATLEKDLGEYPFSIAGGLVTSLPVHFALETQTLPTYPATGLFATSLVVHEQAHQWFGDSVALRRWRDIWLNEGAATFMEARYIERNGGRSADDWLRAEYKSLPASFWKLRIGDPGPDRLFANAVYVRGGLTFQALRNRIGDDLFWELIERWLRENEGANGTRQAFEALAEEVSEQELDAFFTAWLDTPERPANTAENGLG